MGTILTAAYVHSSKEAMLNLGTRLGLKGEALDMFAFACCEVRLGIEVNDKTGAAEIISVDGKTVKHG